MSYATIIWLWAVPFEPFDTSLDDFLIVFNQPLSMFKFAMFCHFDSMELVIFGSLQTWECALNWFLQAQPVHEPNLDMCHLHGFGETYPKHAFFCWSLCANYSLLFWKFVWPLNKTYPKHLPLGYSVGYVLVGVNPHGRCAFVVAPLLELQSFPKIKK